MNDSDRLIELLTNKRKLVAMLAPAFVVCYDYPQIVTRLKALGFEWVVEVSAGAVQTNAQIVDLLKNNPRGRYITSPCAGLVRFIRSTYPQLLPFLTLTVDSPMIATARLCKEQYPAHLPVFLGPCVAKKLEASEDYPDLGILVLTFKELDHVFQKCAIGDCRDHPPQEFDVIERATRIYPLDGGLADTSGIRSLLKPEELRIVSGYKNIPAVLEEFQRNPSIRLVDVLFCEQGCINGPGLKSALSLEDRTKRIVVFRNHA